ncbi:amidophosphoribosyltransferase [Candidatus Mesenet endosymbiont of Agriotes lineatus]|uniref:amidophosphoribosyltransferase n=1 Tax=Candidatus Mesenet endosymbiont of Agriotes lineatus TaxID=3077948 RepID=UPI0030D4825F
MHEECGIFAIACNIKAASNCALGLHALQHRGQESFGIVTSNNNNLFSLHLQGQVNSIFNNMEGIEKLHGRHAIGHVRYSTSGDKSTIQPIVSSCRFGEMAIAHNGNLINATNLTAELTKKGCVFKSSVDTEVVSHLIKISNKETFLDSLIDALNQVKGAYSFVAMTTDEIVGLRDPAGIRPLVLGKVDDAYVLASETCALDIIGASLIRELEAGEVITISKDGKLKSFFPFVREKLSFCIFEYIYFSRPDSVIENQSVYEVRKEIGSVLAQESPPPQDVDMIIPVPDSGIPAAIGYANQSGLPLEFGIIRNHYIGRTFIQPTEQIRNIGVRLKHNTNNHILKNKSIVLIDDSIVRGTTLKKIVFLLLNAGVREIHLRISSPPIKHSCFYGIDTPQREKLMANNFSVEEMIKIMSVSSLNFLSIEGLYHAVKKIKRNDESPQYCDACFTGNYPIDINN